jgi:hypothetical protein
LVQICVIQFFTMKKVTLIVYAAITLLLITSCNEKPASRTSILLSEDSGIFRNISFDLDIDAVKKNETAPLANATEDYLRYELKNINKTSEYAEFEYHFSKNRLDLITVYYATTTKKEAEQLFNEVKKIYDKKFGASKSDDSGWQMWEFEDKEGSPGNIEIMMKHESNNDLHGLDIELVKYYKDERRTASTLPQ